MITLNARLLGRKSPSPSCRVPPPETAGNGPMAVRTLLDHVVREEVRAFRARQEKRALLEVLTPQEIEERAISGRIVPGGPDPQPAVDEDAAVAAALQAFEDGIYLVLLDGRELRSLDDEVELTPASSLTFLRLTLLAGG